MTALAFPHDSPAVADTIKLPGLNLRRLWKITIVDSLDRPTKRTVLLVRKCETAFAAMNLVKQTDGFALFERECSGAEIAVVEMAGITEN